MGLEGGAQNKGQSTRERLQPSTAACAAWMGKSTFALWACLALVLAGAHLSLVATASATASFNETAFYLGGVVAAAPVCLAPLFFHRRSKACIALASFLILPATALLLHTENLAARTTGLTALTGSALYGIGYQALLLFSCIAIARLCSLRTSIVLVTLGNLLSQALASIIEAAFAHVMQPGILLVIPAATLLCVTIPARACPTGSLANKPNADTAVYAYLLLLGITVTISKFLAYAVESVGVSGSQHIQSAMSSLGDPVITVATLALSALLIGALVLPRTNQSVTKRYVAPLVTVGAITLFALVYKNVALKSSDALQCFLASSQDLAYTLVWAMVMNCVSRSAQKTYRYGAAIAMANSGVVVILGRLFTGNNPTADIVVALLLCYGIAVIVALVLPALFLKRPRHLEKPGTDMPVYIPHEQTEEDLGLITQLNGILAQRASILAERYGLSQRETEIFSELCRGRSRPSICASMGLSASTVKTHVAHIYGKLGINSNQELLDLVYGTASSDQTHNT